MCHALRLEKWNDYFWATFDHLFILSQLEEAMKSLLPSYYK